MDCSYPTFLINLKLDVFHPTIIDFTQGSATWARDGGHGFETPCISKHSFTNTNSARNTQVIIAEKLNSSFLLRKFYYQLEVCCIMDRNIPYMSYHG